MRLTRSALVTSILIAIGGCGGGGGTADNDGDGGTTPPPPAATYTVAGTVSGVAGPGVTLQVNGHSDTVIKSDGSFIFADRLSSGAPYKVTVATQPANQTCSVSNSAGTVNDSDVTNITVNCLTNTSRIGGVVSGLSGSGLVLQNGGGNNLSVSANGPFAFSAAISSGATYSVSVLTQPATPSQTCIVANGSGTASNADVTGVQVVCTTNAYALGGNVSGLAGSGLVLQNGSSTLSVFGNGVFTFGAPIASGTSYNVGVSTQPSGPSQTCAVTNGSGLVVNSDVANLFVSCTNNDTTPPTVAATTPLDTSSGAGVQLPITATFSEALSAASLNASSFTLPGPNGVISGTVSLTAGNVANFTPSTPLSFATTYQARLTTAIRDISNNPLASDVVWSFNTGKKIALGAEYGCVRFDDGQLKCWGSNSDGQLGLGNTNNRGDDAGEMASALPAVSLGASRTAIEIAAGGYHMCARLDNNQVKCWGQNVYGQLGLGNTSARGDNSGEMGNSLPAVQLGTGAIVVQLAAGRYFTCARLTTGQVKCWGRNDRGQLGVGDVNSRGDQSGEMGNSLAAINLGTGRTAIDLVSQAYHVCARLDDLTVKCWGENIYGQLGLGDVDSRGDAPGEMGDALATLDPGTGHTIKQLATNSGHTCAILETGSVKCWGHNLYGQLGLGDTDFRGDDPGEIGDAVPTVSFGTGRTALDIVAGSRQTCVLLETRQVKCWGWNDYGQLGFGDVETRGDGPGEMGDTLPTVDLGTGRTVIELESGSFFECARLDDDEIKCWGDNEEGQLGIGDVNNRGDAAGEMGDSLLSIDFGQ